MNNRITISRLQEMCDRINDAKGYPLEPYGENLKPNTDTYLISQQYGGVALHQMCASSGERDISNMGHTSKRELHTFLRGFLESLWSMQK